MDNDKYRCFRFEPHNTVFADCLMRFRTGNKIARIIEMIAITTNNSINVKAVLFMTGNYTKNEE